MFTAACVFLGRRSLRSGGTNMTEIDLNQPFGTDMCKPGWNNFSQNGPI